MAKTTKKSSKPEVQTSLDNVKPLLDERGELHMAKKRIEDRIKQLDEDLRPVLAGRGAFVHNGYQFEVAITAGRTSYDYKAMAADGIDISKYAKVGAPSTRFTVKAVQEL